MLGRYGGTKATERAVAAALYWLAKHQMKDGNWSLKKYTQMCKDKSCTGAGGPRIALGRHGDGLAARSWPPGRRTSATAPSNGRCSGGVYWLMNHQKADGDLSARRRTSQMYSHGLATIALCEDYGMSGDKTVGEAAQRAINFIQAAQNTKTGGWRYHPGEEGDTSVVGWQLMALKSGPNGRPDGRPRHAWRHQEMARVGRRAGGGGSPGSAGNGGQRFSYQPDGGPTPTMSAVGMLCNQYLHAGRAIRSIVGGVQFLMA